MVDSIPRKESRYLLGLRRAMERSLAQQNKSNLRHQIPQSLTSFASVYPSTHLSSVRQTEGQNCQAFQSPTYKSFKQIISDRATLLPKPCARSRSQMNPPARKTIVPFFPPLSLPFHSISEVNTCHLTSHEPQVQHTSLDIGSGER